MVDIRKRLSSKFKRPDRYANFGACINFVDMRGFRGLDCKIRFEFPVTAITGLNGAGKSTVGQILLCGYKKLTTTDYKRWYIKDFFPVSVADPNPFRDDASVEFHYQTSRSNDDQILTVKRVVKEWSGYKRQPEKAAIYIGLAFYLPKVERRDLTIYSSKNLELSSRAEVENGKMWASRILGNNYEDVFFQKVKNKHRSAELGMARRFGARYSENNMGFGEGRVIHAIRLLESCPAQSLIVLEEPETSLHEYAQYEFAKYLMDVSSRRGHQIVFSSHSSAMISALPPEGRKMLSRNEDGVIVYNRLSSIHLRNALTDGVKGHVIVCVEDVFAQSLLRELVRCKRPELLKRIKIQAFGDAVAVKGAVKVLRDSGIKAIGIRDGDQAEIDRDLLKKLPGYCAPERIIFLSQEAKHVLKDNYQFDLDAYLSSYPDTNHHEYSKIASVLTGTSRDVLETDCIRAFLEAQPDDWASDLLDWIEENA